MGRKGVSKRKKAKEKSPVAAGNSASNERKPDNQAEQVTEKKKTWSKDNKKQ
jgi:hypothetical protein